MTVTCLYDHLSCRSYEYGSRAGFWRLHREFTKRHMPVTVYAVAKALELNPAAGKVGGMWQDLTRHVRQRVTLDSVPDARCTCVTATALRPWWRQGGRWPATGTGGSTIRTCPRRRSASTSAR